MAMEITAEAEALRQDILSKLTYEVGGRAERASARDWFLAATLATRDRIVDRWRASNDETVAQGHKRVCYLSMEFLIGRLLSDALGNLGLTEAMRQALDGVGVDLEEVCAQEPDAALGNGGLGRLAACFMESMASIGIPAVGYGIRYENGLFRQLIQDGRQMEVPEDWLSLGNPWEFERSGITYDIGFGGHVVRRPDGGLVWHPGEVVRAIAYDTPVVGWRGHWVNTLRLWSARATDPLHLDAFNSGDHVGAQLTRMQAEAISRVLYPGDENAAGQELRLRQEYFFASASLQDLIQRHLRLYGDIATLAEKVAVQLNDTHPAIGVAELMRLLVDVQGVEWDRAWDIARATFSYTNHTLMPEALESWPVALMERLLPRNMQIIYLINARHLEKARQQGANDALLSAVSLIDEHHGRRVRMGHLAFVGSHKINGVSALHTGLMRSTVFAELDRVCPGRITNKTNGITFRRWLMRANPGLTSLIVETIGPRVLDEPERLADLAPYARDAAFQRAFAAQRRKAKESLTRLVRARTGVMLDPASLFDVQVKRIHEYKRQLLNILHTVALYNSMRAQPMGSWVPQTKIFAGKAAPSYHQAKLIIRLANDVGKVINSDPTVRDLLRVVFIPNYNVTLAESIMPAADLSEQISTAGLEASGTGNMKFALNGALTIGTLDGANIEISERVGLENIFIFGLRASEAGPLRRDGYDARAAVAGNDELRGVLDAIASGVFSPEEPDRYRALVEGLLAHDNFLVTADFASYVATQRQVAQRWGQPAEWWRSAVLNTANVAWFSSDRTIREYADEIWDLPVR
ncbi:glycogen/starch/alpha-glucan phosphorylase [Roseomonas marmotae]|uniref:Alpha-1,4 glucan phosphorylase n=2 Tax=Roseomonas marmotae TaxID=2768161 RepID=A0ABS3KGY2_9PROT|nr:glycogen/starch/alpha-glucan phosphorylase [Roseomonas marmotae]MBO1076677.1 glycogen/starch/alpha-glucan phosphorylase [Roseomonas marmotae]QTI80800.1 glycogen/starch/alpha-glucan phosphorylase [Roseomonas marmotae]